VATKPLRWLWLLASAGNAGDRRQNLGATNPDGESPVPAREVVARISECAPLWDELFPAEQARIVRLLVERIDLSPDGMQVRLRVEGLQTLVQELPSPEVKAA
jgi:hypothetical protein